VKKNNIKQATQTSTGGSLYKQDQEEKKESLKARKIIETEDLIIQTIGPIQMGEKRIQDAMNEECLTMEIARNLKEKIVKEKDNESKHLMKN